VALIHILDLIGVFAFAVYGSHKAVVARFDLFGVLTCGALTAFGGGTIRELMLNNTPAYLHDYSFLIAAMLGTVLAIALHSRFRRLEKYLLLVDAIGIAVFAYIGAQRAGEYHLGLTAMIFFGTLTAAGGGVLSDIVSGRRPEAFYKDFYPLAAIVVAATYYLIQPSGQAVVPALTLIIFGFTVRLVSIRLKLILWKPYKKWRARTLAAWRRRLSIAAKG